MFNTSIRANILYWEEDRSIITEPNYFPTHFTLMTGCVYLGMDINLDNMQLMGITGFCPRSAWDGEILVPPNNIEEGRVFIKTKRNWMPGMGDDLAEETPIYFCEENNWICIGDKDINNYDCNVKFMENAIISLKNNEFKALWINPIYK